MHACFMSNKLEEIVMTIDYPRQICRRPDCACEVGAGQQYCSEHCRTAAEHVGTMEDEMESACACGHPECDQS